MSIYIRCQYLPPPGMPLADRIAELARVLDGSEQLARIGPDWFELGRSRKQALKSNVPLATLSESATAVTRVPLSDGRAYYDVHLWNGASSGKDASLNFSVYDPPSEPDQIGFDLDFERLRELASWDEVLAATAALATRLGGCSIITSHELCSESAKRNLQGADHAAFAAFWGEDRSGRNPLFHWLTETCARPPFSVRACDSWDEADHPDTDRLAAICETLAAVASRAGENSRT